MVKVEVPDNLREKAEKKGFDWSQLISRLIKNLEEEEKAIEWSLKLQKSSRKGRYEGLKKKGLV